MLLLLGAFAALCAHGLRWDSPTVDEFAHLPAGYYYLKTADFDLYDLNPPLPRLLSALPLLALAPQLPAAPRVPSLLSTPATPSTPAVAAALHRQESGWYPWIFATDFMRRNRDRFEEIFLLGRLPVVALGLLLLLLVWHWARQLYGEEAALVALAAGAFCPSLIAHSHLATTDTCFALAVVGALYLAQRYLRRPGPGALLAAGVGLGLAQLTKFSAVLLYPVLLALALLALARGRRFPLLGRPIGRTSAESGEHAESGESGNGGERQGLSEPAALAWSLASMAVVVLVSLVVLDAGYLFEGVGQAAAAVHFRSRLLRGLGAVLPGWLPLAFPTPYLHGFDSLQLINEQGEFPTYLCGRWFPGGSPLYYPLTLLFKTPLPLLAAWIAAPFVRLPAANARPADPVGQFEAFLWLPALTLLAVFSLGSEVGYGIRYLLPILPLACIYASRLVPWVLGRGRALRAAALALLLAYPVSALLATPDTIDYFNLLAGGHGDRFLLDSNLDWGQGLERLRAYLKRERLPGIDLAYFGHVDPAIYGIRWRFPDPGHPGLAAVSANFLHGYPYVTNLAGRMVPVPPGAFTWLARYPRRADLGGGLYVYEIGAAEGSRRGAWSDRSAARSRASATRLAAR